MKLIVFSDSHGNIDSMESVINSCKTEDTFLVHLGDKVSDFRRIVERYPDLPNVFVKGNNDFLEIDAKSEYVGFIGGVKCLVTHGHQYGIKSSMNGIFVRARGLSSELVLFGHTHVPFKQNHGNTLFFNPGTIGQGSTLTFGIIELDNGAILSAEILKYNQVTREIDFFRGF